MTFLFFDNRFSRLVYDPKITLVIDRLWDETLAELEFAGVRKILGLEKK